MSVKFKKQLCITAYTSLGQIIGSKVVDKEPSEQELELFANGYQQADYLKIETVYRYQ
jgi:hypothetical protein